MKTLWKSLKLTVAFCAILGVFYVAVLRAFAQAATPRGGRIETLSAGGRTVGAANVGQAFTDSAYFWGRPSAVDYNAALSGGSNMGTCNPDYLAEVESRTVKFLSAHPYLSRGDVPAELVTASGSGLDPDITPYGARIQVRRVAEARGLDTAAVRRLVDSLTARPWLGIFGPAKVNVLKLNIALGTMPSGAGE